MNWSTNGPTNWSINWTTWQMSEPNNGQSNGKVNWTTNGLMNVSVVEPTSELIYGESNGLMNYTTNGSINQPVNGGSNRPTNGPTSNSNLFQESSQTTNIQGARLSVTLNNKSSSRATSEPVSFSSALLMSLASATSTSAGINVYTSRAAPLSSLLQEFPSVKAFVFSGYIGSPDNTATGYRTENLGTNTMALSSLYLVLRSMTWTESQSYCRQHYTDLAAVTSSKEHSTISFFLSTQTSGTRYWFGLRKSQFWGNWYWSGGQSFGEYTNWGQGEPLEPLSKMCGLISNPAENLSWSSECCVMRLPFLCYKMD
ncbi:Hypothetical predicted protein [Pelobates cultripes]|uniref:C-type lectin domain-containing protein n=1 Tax=Pelobates cultripes TaxID=61616 RepID=A0AAD1RI60_PELCU|nr:Hypothetical predicted protein [Pelobates cultripes]